MHADFSCGRVVMNLYEMCLANIAGHDIDWNEEQIQLSSGKSSVNLTVPASTIQQADIPFYCQEYLYISDLHLEYQISVEFPNGATDSCIKSYVTEMALKLARSVPKESHFFPRPILFGGDISASVELSSTFYSAFMGEICFSSYTSFGLGSPHPEVVWILDLCQQIRCSLSLRTYFSCAPRFSSSTGKMGHTGRTLCVPLGYEDDGVVYTDCSQFPCFPDSRMKYGILICLSTAVKKLQDLLLIFAICLQFSEILAVRRSFSGNFQPFPHFFPQSFDSRTKLPVRLPLEQFGQWHSLILPVMSFAENH